MPSQRKVLLVKDRKNKIIFVEDGVVMNHVTFDTRVADLQDNGWRVKSWSSAWWRRGGQKVVMTKTGVK